METNPGTTLRSAANRSEIRGISAARESFTLQRGLLAAVAVFALLATSLAHTKAPWCDEGWFANPAYNLAFHGYMGTNVLEPSGHFLNAYLKGIQQNTYIVVPNHLVALAAWFRIFGFSLFSMREYSIVWGSLGICCFVYILQQMLADRGVAIAAGLLLSIDFIYLWSSADGRMESSVLALSLGSIASYLHFRSRNLSQAVWVSQLLGAAAVFTHPNAVFVLVVLLLLVWRFDSASLRWRHLFMAGTPYLCFAALWMLYILRSPGDFAAQFFANAAGRDGTRLQTLTHPWRAMWGELVRHLAPYCISGMWSAQVGQWTVLIPLFYLASFVWLCRQWKELAAAERLFLSCTLVMATGMTFLNGFKSPMYLVYLIPFYDGVLALGLMKLATRGLAARAAAAMLATLYGGLQFSEVVRHVRADEYHRSYEPAIAKLKQEQSEGKTIVGTAALGFGLGFQGFTDDWRLGFYSRRDSDVVIVDPAYREFIQKFEGEEPKVFAHDVAALAGNYQLSKRFGRILLFEKRKPEARRVQPTWVDIGGIAQQPKGTRGEYVFRQILAAVASPKEEIAANNL